MLSAQWWKKLKFLRPALNALPVGAFLFALLYIWRMDTSWHFQSLSMDLLTLSVGMLGIVFIIRAIIWQRVLKRFDVFVDLPAAFYSEAVTVLMKYIPGKVWGLVGKADLIARLGYTLRRCSAVALFLQLLMLLSGLLVGVAGVLVFNFLVLPPAVAYGLLILFSASILVFSRPHTLPAVVLRWIPASHRALFEKQIPPVADILLFCILHWILLGTAFMWFIASIGYHVGTMPILLQPLANNIGILSVFAPGGIGVREGAAVGYLVLADISLTQAIAIAVACRLWFFAVEVGIYVSGWIVKKTLT